MTTLYDLVAATVAGHPDRVAVETSAGALTYAELWSRAGQVAAGLPRSAPPFRVALVGTHAEFVCVGYLAILRAGGTVLPLNPEFPADRNAYMAETAGAAVTLVEPGNDAGRMPLAAHEPDSPPGEDDDAYILFTSGSTGRPKGVPVRHSAAVAYVRHAASRAGVTPASRLSHTFQLTFDPSVFDLFAAWSRGAALVIPQQRDLLRPAEFVHERGITHWFSVPSVISMSRRLRNLGANSMPGLRWSGFIGEQLTVEQALAWRAAAPAAIIDNVYGPTELTVACTEFRWPVTGGDLPQTPNRTVPIGAVYPGLEYVLLDETGREGVEGELCVRGVQRFAGYLDPADNIGRFLAFEPGHRAEVYTGTGPLTDRHWYRTGDQVRRDGDTLIHMGRGDRQVKLRGYRVELGEIEGVLRRHRGVTDAVVLVIDSGSDMVLHAWYSASAEVDPAALRAHLKAALPDYMVPAKLTAIEAMPLNPNGKIDHLALRAAAAAV